MNAREAARVMVRDDEFVAASQLPDPSETVHVDGVTLRVGQDSHVALMHSLKYHGQERF